MYLVHCGSKFGQKFRLSRFTEILFCFLHGLTLTSYSCVEVWVLVYCCRFQYICEEHFQKLSGGCSVFTGLKATTHFGRPKLNEMFEAVHKAHPLVSHINVHAATQCIT